MCVTTQRECWASVSNPVSNRPRVNADLIKGRDVDMAQVVELNVGENLTGVYSLCLPSKLASLEQTLQVFLFTRAITRRCKGVFG